MPDCVDLGAHHIVAHHFGAYYIIPNHLGACHRGTDDSGLGLSEKLRYPRSWRRHVSVQREFRCGLGSRFPLHHLPQALRYSLLVPSPYFPLILPAVLPKIQGRCTSCNENRLRVSGRCVTLVYCRGRRIQSGSLLGQNCRCLNDHCQYCNRAVSGDVCRVVSRTQASIPPYLPLRQCPSVSPTLSFADGVHMHARCSRSAATRGTSWMANASSPARPHWPVWGLERSNGAAWSRSPAKTAGSSART